MLTLSLFTEIGFRGCFIHKGIDFNACLFFFFPSPSSSFLSWQMPQSEEKGREEAGGGGGGRSGEKPLLDCIFITAVARGSSVGKPSLLFVFSVRSLRVRPENTRDNFVNKHLVVQKACFTLEIHIRQKQACDMLLRGLLGIFLIGND